MAQMVKMIKAFQFSDYAVVEWENNGHYQWVACWCPYVINPETDLFDEWRKPSTLDEGEMVNSYWGQGHYFQDKDDAMEYALEKERQAVEAQIDNLNGYLERLGKEELV